MAAFAERYRELIALVYPPLAPGDGFAEEEAND